MALHPVTHRPDNADDELCKFSRAAERNKIALGALQGLIAAGDAWSVCEPAPETYARKAYAIADAMLAEAEKETP